MEDLQPLRQTYRLYDFLKSNQNKLQIISEVKKASPSMGDINLDVDIVAQALSKEMEEKTQLNIEFLKNIEVQQAQLGILEKEKLEHFKKNELDRLADEDDVNTLLNESRITLSKKEKSAAEAAAKQRLPFCRLERPESPRLRRSLQ